MWIKNRQIIHFVRGKHYICNRACFTTKEKRTRIKSEVTCKNCLRELKRKKNGKC